MNLPIIITGTGTSTGKTLLSSLIMKKFGKSKNLFYRKIIQTGEEDDTSRVRDFSGLQGEYFLEPVYRFTYPASPHFSSRREKKIVDYRHLLTELQDTQANVLYEMSGGILVPLNEEKTNLDLLTDLGYPVLIAGLAALGGINHMLLTLESLQRNEVDVLGYFLLGENGELEEDNAREISQRSGISFFGYMSLGMDLTEFDSEGHLHRIFR